MAIESDPESLNSDGIKVPAEPMLEASSRILLADVPPPATRRHFAPTVPMILEEEPKAIDDAPSEIDEERRMFDWHAAKHIASRGYFDPFKAFEDDVDWEKFTKAQIYLSLTSLIGPFLLLLVFSFIAAVLFHAIAALNSVTPPNSFFELTLYPSVYILAKGYWIAYLVLPMGILLAGWMWAAVTAWSLSRKSDCDFKQLFSILAMLGAMFAPFVLFPFFRLLALGFLIWYTTKRMMGYFDISPSRLAKFGGGFLLVFSGLFSWFERRVESHFAEPSELSRNLNGYYMNKQKLVWPVFHGVTPPSPNQILLDGLGSLDTDTRELAIKKGIEILANSRETPEYRLNIALRIAALGNSTGMAYAARAFQLGQGTHVDYAQALEWSQKACESDPKQLDWGLDEAHLLFLNKHALDAKRRFVSLAKDNIASLDKIINYISRANLGSPEHALLWDVQNLYRQDTSNTYSYSNSTYSRGRSFGDTLVLKENLLQRIATIDRDGNQWFYRALVSECGNSAPADPEVYGEAPYTAEEFQKKLDLNDPAALENAGDQNYEKGDFATARKFWLKAALALDGDKRRPNARYYLKIAESYMQTDDKTDVREAIRFYLGYLLLTDHSGNSNSKVIASLKRLGISVNVDVDVSSFQYILLCAKYDVPEAWAIMGSYFMGGNIEGVQKNLVRAKDCFEKAKALGYKGPLVNMLDGKEVKTN